MLNEENCHKENDIGLEFEIIVSVSICSPCLAVRCSAPEVVPSQKYCYEPLVFWSTGEARLNKVNEI